MAWATPRLVEGGIELYAGGAVRHSISTIPLLEALRTFLALRLHLARGAEAGLSELRKALD